MRRSRSADICRGFSGPAKHRKHGRPRIVAGTGGQRAAAAGNGGDVSRGRGGGAAACARDTTPCPVSLTPRLAGADDRLDVMGRVDGGGARVDGLDAWRHERGFSGECGAALGGDFCLHAGGAAGARAPADGGRFFFAGAVESAVFVARRIRSHSAGHGTPGPHGRRDHRDEERSFAAVCGGAWALALPCWFWWRKAF